MVNTYVCLLSQYNIWENRIIRLLDKSYLPGGRFYPTLALTTRPLSILQGSPRLDKKIFILISMLSTSYLAHFNAPKFYKELKDTSIFRFNQVVGGAFGISITIFVAVLCVGFLTFGANTSGFILNNYARFIFGTNCLSIDEK